VLLGQLDVADVAELAEVLLNLELGSDGAVGGAVLGLLLLGHALAIGVELLDRVRLLFLLLSLLLLRLHGGVVALSLLRGLIARVLHIEPQQQTRRELESLLLPVATPPMEPSTPTSHTRFVFV
jgi:hypothetical protein